MKDNRGYIVVETILAFLPFLFVVLFVLSLVQVISLESRVHYALTQTAQEISIHSYVSKLQADGEELNGIVEFITGVNSLFNLPDGLSISDDVIYSIAGYADNADESEIMSLFGKYLSGSEPLEEYLTRMNVTDTMNGFDFSGSDTANGDITITVKYKVNLPFMAVFGADFTAFPVVQTASTKSWASGNGKGYGDMHSGSGGGR